KKKQESEAYQRVKLDMLDGLGNIDSDESIEEAEGYVSLSENEDNDYVGETEDNSIFYH
ncbi:hypothetical protein A2U01_0089242, partial [Trifolium medium]|nr:hypothetical protein [Trifolium medium]